MPPSPALPRIPRARAALCLSILAFMIGGPFYRQVLGGDSRIFRDWVMYDDFGLGVCRVDYSRRLPGGGAERVDRFAVLGYPEGAAAPPWLWRISSSGKAFDVGELLCHALGPGADLRIDVACAGIGGWRQEARGDHDVCAGLR
jgi:hypothetical protein